MAKDRNDLPQIIELQQKEKKLYKNSECEKCECWDYDVQLVNFSNGKFIICHNCLESKRTVHKIKNNI